MRAFTALDAASCTIPPLGLALFLLSTVTQAGEPAPHAAPPPEAARVAAKGGAPEPAPAAEHDTAPAGDHGAAPAGEHGEHEGHGEHGEHEGHGEHGPHAHREFFVGAHFAALGSFKGDEKESHLGLGGFFEVSAIHNWLEIEFGLRMLSGKDGVEIPLDLVFKKPFHLNSWIHPYVGLGPTVLLTPGSSESAAHLGLATAVGSYFWLTRHTGLTAELNYNLISDGGAVHEVGGAAGFVVGY
jgi:hypothetical protein